MATLEQILTFGEDDPDLPAIRNNIREAMRNRRWEIIAKRADIAAFSTPVSADIGEADRRNQAAHAAAREYELASHIAAYNSLADQLAALPPEKKAPKA